MSVVQTRVPYDRTGPTWVRDHPGLLRGIYYLSHDGNLRALPDREARILEDLFGAVAERHVLKAGDNVSQTAAATLPAMKARVCGVQ